MDIKLKSWDLNFDKAPTVNSINIPHRVIPEEFQWNFASGMNLSITGLRDVGFKTTLKSNHVYLLLPYADLEATWVSTLPTLTSGGQTSTSFAGNGMFYLWTGSILATTLVLQYMNGLEEQITLNQLSNNTIYFIGNLIDCGEQQTWPTRTVSISSAEGVDYAYISTTTNAQAGSSTSKYKVGETVYAFARLKLNKALPQSNWQHVYSTSSYNWYQIDSTIVNNNGYNFGAIKAKGVKFTASAGVGVDSVFFSTDATATSGKASGSTYYEAYTVYAFVKAGVYCNSNDIASNLTLVSGTRGLPGAIYRVGNGVTFSNLSNVTSYNFGTLDIIDTTKASDVVMLRVEDTDGELVPGCVYGGPAQCSMILPGNGAYFSYDNGNSDEAETRTISATYDDAYGDNVTYEVLSVTKPDDLRWDDQSPILRDTSGTVLTIENTYHSMPVIFTWVIDA